jgi:Trm5-related predicted tRNA methylase
VCGIKLYPQPNPRLFVFKGREARFNRAIFQSLALKGAQTIYDIHKHVRTFRGLKYTYYGNMNKRVRALQQQGYVREVNVRGTRAGFEATEYELTTGGYLALMLDSVNLEDLLSRMDDDVASEILAAVATLT